MKYRMLMEEGPLTWAAAATETTPPEGWLEVPEESLAALLAAGLRGGCVVAIALVELAGAEDERGA